MDDVASSAVNLTELSSQLDQVINQFNIDGSKEHLNVEFETENTSNENSILNVQNKVLSNQESEELTDTVHYIIEETNQIDNNEVEQEIENNRDYESLIEQTEEFDKDHLVSNVKLSN